VVSIGDVDAIHDEVRDDLRCDHVETLGTHKQLLYDIVAEVGEISVGELHTEYENRCGDPEDQTDPTAVFEDA